MGIGMNGDDIVIKLSMDIDDVKQSLADLQRQVERSMGDIQDEFSDSARSIDKIDDAVDDLRSEVNSNFGKMENKVKNSASDIKNSMTKSFDKISSVAKNLARTLITTFSVREVFNFGKAVVEATAELDALDAQFEQVMKGMEKEAQDAVKRMSDEFGMLPNRLRGNLSAFTSQFKGLGLEDAEALKEAEAALTLSADAAAFFDMTVEEATEHVRSFIKGNYIGGESVQLFGSETMIAAWAAQNMGSELNALGGKWKELDEKSKQYFRMRYAEQMYKEAGVTGQAHREMDMYANVLGNAKQAWTDFKASIGTSLLENANGALKAISDNLKSITESGSLDTFANSLGKVGGIVLDGAVNGIEKVVNWISSVDWWLVGEQIGTCWDNFKKFLDPIADMVLENLGEIGDFILGFFGESSEDVNTKNMDDVNKCLVEIKPTFEWLAEHGKEVADALEAIAKAFLLWKSIKIGLSVAEGFKEIASMGFVKWLLTKLGVSGLSSIGIFSGTMLFALTGLIWLGFEVGWGEDPEVNKEMAKRNENLLDVNMYGGGKKSTNYGIGTGGGIASKGTKDKLGEDLKKQGWFGSGKGLSSGSEDDIFADMKQQWKNFWSFLDTESESGGAKVTANVDIFGNNLFTESEEIGVTQKGLKDNTYNSLEDMKKQWWNFDGSFMDISESLNKTMSNLWDNFKKYGENMVIWFQGLFARMANACTGGGGTFAKSFSDVLDDAIIKFNIKVNSLIGVINSFFEKLGISTRIGSVTIGNSHQKYGSTKLKGNKMDFLANGTDNWRGGNAIVGEAGREIVADPKLGVFMANSATLLNLSKGATVLSNKNTEKFLKGFGVKAYAKGKNEGGFWSNVWDYVKDPSKVVEELFSGLSTMGGSKIHDAIEELITNGFRSGVKEFITNILNSDEVITNINHPDNKFAGSGAGYATAMTWARQALSIAGYKPDMQAYKDFMTAYQIVGRYESNYNNSALNNWDDNAKKGTPSGGWLQFIKPTFMANAFKGYTDWGNGMHQALAFINYANRRYGGALKVPGVKSVLAGGRYRPYANGGLITNPTMALMGEAGTEAVVPLSNAKALKPFGQSVVDAIVSNGTSGETSYEFTIPVIVDGREIARATATFTKAELDKMEKRNNRLHGKK